MVRFGGNTACVHVRPSDGTDIVFDCGTGARALGRHLVAEAGEQAPGVHILITHTHWDHIQGFPFFAPIYVPGAEVSVYGPAGLDFGLESALAGQMQHTYFPVHLHALGSRLRARELGEGVFSIGAVRVRAQYLNHTAPTLGYRVEFGGVSVVYATDHEPFWWARSPRDKLPEMAHPGDRRHLAFLEGADLVIHDAQYRDLEYPGRRGWGHATVEYVVDIACLAGVKQLVLFHHDPDRSDAAINHLLARAREQARRKSDGRLEVLAAAEGLSLTLLERLEGVGTAESDEWIRRPAPGRRVVVAATDPNELLALSEALSPDGHAVRPVSDPKTLLSIIRGEGPELLLLAVQPTDQPPDALVEAVRRVPGMADLPIILITNGLPRAATNRLLALGTDMLFRPYGAPMLRARVRAWLARYVDQRKRQEPVPYRLGPDRRAARRELKADVFSGVLDEQGALQAGATVETFLPGEVLFREGDPSDGTYVILDGTVRILVGSRDGQEIYLGAAGPGDTIGELGALDGGPRSATGVAETDLRALFLRREAFLQFLCAHPDQAIRLMRILAARIRAADRQLVDLASATLYVRLAKRLLELKDEPDALQRITAADLARQVGSEPDAVQAVLEGMRRLGAIRCAAGRIEIADPDQLRLLLRQ